MKRSHIDTTRCVFRVRCHSAEQVKLVIDRGGGASQIFSLQRLDGDLWETALDLMPGTYRYCYHAYNGRTLTYITPPDAPIEGLKAILHVALPHTMIGRKVAKADSLIDSSPKG